MLPVNIDRYHTTNRTATCNRTVFVGARGWPISSMVTVYDNGTYIGNSPKDILIIQVYKNYVNMKHCWGQKINESVIKTANR